MLKVAVLVSGGGTNLQAIMDGIATGKITNAKIEVWSSAIIPSVYALTRAGKNHGIPANCISPKEFESREKYSIKHS